MRRLVPRLALLGLLGAVAGPRAWAGDWPMYRYDAGRCAASPDDLPAELHLQWVRHLPAPRPAWPPTQEKLQFDRSYEPVVSGKLLLVGSMVRDRLTAYETGTGAERWRFYADGPIRFAPVAADGKVWFVSDDGHLYCLRAENGRLLWKRRGGPRARPVLGNGRLVSSWPARGAPVLCDGVIYFAAGLWPFMGIFIHAVDAETGEIVWTNSGSGSTYQLQPHVSPAFAGVAPQGYLAVAGERLLVAGGRSVPACYDRRTGKLLYYQLADSSLGKQIGGSTVAAHGPWFFNGNVLFRLADGQRLVGLAAAIVGDDGIIDLDYGWPRARTIEPPEARRVEYQDTRGRTRRRFEVTYRTQWTTALDTELERLFIRAGSRVYGVTADRTVVAVEVPRAGRPAQIRWRQPIGDAVFTMLAGDDKLFVVTESGRLYCFGGRQVPTQTLAAMGPPPPPPLPRAADARRLLKAAGDPEGVCLVLGLRDGELLTALAYGSRMQVVGIDPDAGKIAALRRMLDRKGMYGTQVALIQGDPGSLELPSYVANLIVSERPESIDSGSAIEAVFGCLRPYGGVACFDLSGGSEEAHGRVPAPRRDLASSAGARADTPPVARGTRTETFADAARALQLDGAEVSASDGLVVLRRRGALPGSADWTHQYADVANSVFSPDVRVRAPLGLLWWGGPSHADVLPRHGHGPTPQVVGGRLFIEGPDMLRATDVYTGRLLWQRRLENLGRYYDNLSHQPGANEIGSNYVSVADGIYVVHEGACLRLEPASGRTVKRFTLPTIGEQRPNWGYVGVYEDLLIAGAAPLRVKLEWDRENERMVARNPSPNARYGTGSQRLVVMDRHTGKVLWSRDAAYAFRHNTIAAGGGRIYCIDNLTKPRLAALRRRGQVSDATPTLYALDARSGRVVWQTGEDVFGSWLGYSAEHDRLLQAGSASRDRALDEVNTGMAVYRAADGEVVWKNLAVEYRGPCMLRHDTIITQTSALALHTGKPVLRSDPLTGVAVPWTFKRQYGCNTVIASEHVLTFRSAAAGFFDLACDGGTSNLGGFKSGCTSNLIVANGVLNAPDYTRTCTCAYQNQTSLAFVHDPQVETWSFNALAYNGGPIRRIGLNFGAPGDRRADDGTLWLDIPSVGGPSPKVPVTFDPPEPECFRDHHTRVAAGELPWVAASGVRGPVRITVALSAQPTAPRAVEVRLIFAEVEDVADGQRVFDVAIQDRPVLRAFDVVKAAGGPRRSIVKSVEGVKVTRDLAISLSATGSSTRPPMLCGVQIVAEQP